MKTYRVGFAPEALGQVEAVRIWWAANWPAAPQLFDDEEAGLVWIVALWHSSRGQGPSL